MATVDRKSPDVDRRLALAFNLDGTGQEVYHEVVRYVLRHGRRRSPRGTPTRDVGHTTVVLQDPTHALPIGTGRGVSRRIAAAEAVQLVGGFSDPSLLPPSFDEYREDNGSFWGAYGRRIGDQLIHVSRKLKSDADSRRAVISLWDPILDNQDDRRDYPCTLVLGFALVADELTMNVTMRSNDVIRGIAYDWFQFTQLQLTIARMLDVPAGAYHHTAWSLHLYETDLDLAEQIIAPTAEAREVFQPEGIGWAPGESAYVIRQRARQLAAGILSDPTEHERWYADALRSEKP